MTKNRNSSNGRTQMGGKKQETVEEKESESKYIHTSDYKKTKHSLNVSVEVE